MKPVFLAALCLAALAGCKEELADVPLPVTMTSEALGHYCQMNLNEHPGPKAQVHLKGLAEPLYFAQVRDAIAYQRMPEQSHAIAAVYVNDMSEAPSWESPGIDNWIAASEAHYVIGSKMTGGMGAPETVPFSDPEDARTFAREHGGHVVALAAITEDDVLAPAEQGHDHGHDMTDGADFKDRLSRLTGDH